MRFILSLSILFGLAGTLHAQKAPYNPYAPQREMLAPIKPDGTLNWPAFFKSAKLEARYQMYFAMGSCRGTNKSIVNMLENNKVDVNELPEATFAGLVTGGQTGIVTMLDATGQGATLVTHPAGVTKITVSGRMPAAGLRPGMTVKLAAQVDEHGVGLKPVDALEVITPSPQQKPPALHPDRLQTIIGTVARVESNKLRLTIASGTMHRVTLQLAPDAVIDVHGSSLDLFSVGDTITAKGHVYAGEGSLGARTVFAGEITVSKNAPTAALAAQ